MARAIGYVVLFTLLVAAGCGQAEGQLGHSEKAMGGIGGGGSSYPVSKLDLPRFRSIRDVAEGYLKSAGRLDVSPSGFLAVTDPMAHRVFVLWPDGRVRLSIPVHEPLACAFLTDEYLLVGDGAWGDVRVYRLLGEKAFFKTRLQGGIGQFARPGDIAVDRVSRRIYVVDSEADSVSVFAPAGNFLFSFGQSGSGPGMLDFPTGIALDGSTREVYVSDHDNARVVVFDRDGNYLRSFGSYGSDVGQLNRPQGIAIDGRGRVFVVDAFQGRLQVFDRKGAFVGYVGTFGRARGQLYTPSDVAMDKAAGRMLVTSNGTGKLVAFEAGIPHLVRPYGGLLVMPMRKDGERR